MSSSKSSKLSGNIVVPGDKSISHRALIIGSLVSGKIKITNLLESDDVIAPANALKTLQISMNGKVCIDVGCSTGGFTHVMLEDGAKKIYAVDVGYGLFDWRLRNSEKVELLERTNARNLSKEKIPENVDVIVCDVSFISIKKIFIPLKNFLKSSYQIVSLIKPQFEVTRKEVGKGGIVRDSLIHNKVCSDLKLWFKNNFDYKNIQILESQILGQKGNKEFFIYIKN